MGNCVTDWVFRRQRFCCCLPARLGAGLLALLTLLVSGLLMVILWFEVATDYFMSGKEKTAFILAGILETFLFIASVLGFIGVCARKQSFVLIFSLFLYVHFFINLGVAGYFLWMVTHTANKDIVKLCEEGIRNEQAQGQCKGLLNVTKAVYWGVSLTVLAVEAYCTLVVTRYVNQLRYEKRDARRSRLLARQSAYDAFHARFSSSSSASYPGSSLGADEEARVGEKHYSSLSGTTVAHHEHDQAGDGDGDLEKSMGEGKEALLDAAEVQMKPFDPYEPYDPHPENARAAAAAVVVARAATPIPTTVPEERTRASGHGRINMDVDVDVDLDLDSESHRTMHRSEAERRLTTNSLSSDVNANSNFGAGVGVGVGVGAHSDPGPGPGKIAQSPVKATGATAAAAAASGGGGGGMILPPGAAPPIPPTTTTTTATTISTRLGSWDPRTFSPPSSYRK